MTSPGNAKGPNPTRVFWKRFKGILCWPRNRCYMEDPECGEWGWGKPLRAPYDGYDNPPCVPDEYDKNELINPPYGTPEESFYTIDEIEDDDGLLCLLEYDTSGEIRARRHQGWPFEEVPFDEIGVNQFDWRGLPSAPGEDDFPMLHIPGPWSRYFEAFAPGPAPTTLRIGQNTLLYRDYFWDEDGRRIPGPLETGDYAGPGPSPERPNWSKIRGAAIWGQDTPDPHYVVICGGDIQRDVIQVYKRPVRDDDAPWELVGEVSDIREGTSIDGWGHDSPTFPTGGLGPPNNGEGYISGYGWRWDVPWHFNATGNKAIQYKITRRGTGDPVGAFNGTVKYEISIPDLSSVSLSFSNAGSAGTQSTNQSCTENSSGNNGPLACDSQAPGTQCGTGGLPTFSNSTSSSSKSSSSVTTNVVGVLAGDYEWPNDNVIEFSVQRDSSDIRSSNSSNFSNNTWTSCWIQPVFTCSNEIVCGSPAGNSGGSATRTYDAQVDREYKITGGATFSVTEYDSTTQVYNYNQTGSYTGGGTQPLPCPPAVSTLNTTQSLDIPSTIEGSYSEWQQLVTVMGADLRYKTVLFQVDFTEYINDFYVVESDLPISPANSGGYRDVTVCVGLPPTCFPDPEIVVSPITINNILACRSGQYAPDQISGGWTSLKPKRQVWLMEGTTTTKIEEAEEVFDKWLVVGSGGNYICAPIVTEGFTGCINDSSVLTVEPGAAFTSTAAGATGQASDAASEGPRLVVDRRGKIMYSFDTNPRGFRGPLASGQYSGMFQKKAYSAYEAIADLTTLDLHDPASGDRCCKDEGCRSVVNQPLGDYPAETYWPLFCM